MSDMQNDNRTFEADMAAGSVPVGHGELEKWYQEFNDRQMRRHRPTVDELRDTIDKLPELTTERRERIIQQCMMNLAMKRDDSSSFDTAKQMLGMYLTLTVMFALEVQKRWEQEQSLRQLERSQERFVRRHAARENSVQSSVDNIAAGRYVQSDIRNTMLNQAAARFKTYAVTQMNDGNQVIPGIPDAHVCWFINNVIDRAGGVAGAIIADPRMVGDIVHDQADMVLRAADSGEMSIEDAQVEFNDAMREIYTHHVLAGTPLSLINEGIIDAEITSHEGWDELPDHDWMTNPRLQAMLKFDQMQNINNGTDRVLRLGEDGNIWEEYVSESGQVMRALGFSGQLSLRKPVTEADVIANGERLQALVDKAVSEGRIEDVCASYHRMQNRLWNNPEYGFWDNTGVSIEDQEMFEIVAVSCYAALDERDRIYRDTGEWVGDLCFIENVGETNIQESLSAIMDVAYQAMDKEVYLQSLGHLVNDLGRSMDPLGDGSYMDGFRPETPEDMYGIDAIMFGSEVDGQRAFGFGGQMCDTIAGKIMQLNARAYADGIDLGLITEQTAMGLSCIYDYVGLSDTAYKEAGWEKSPREMLNQFIDTFESKSSADHPEVIGTCADGLPLITPIKTNIGSQIWWKSERCSDETPLAKRIPPRVFSKSEFVDMCHKEVNYRLEPENEVSAAVAQEETEAERELRALVAGIEDNGRDDDYQIEI